MGKNYGIGMFRIGPRTLVKCHSAIRFAESITMQSVVQNTTVPVPRVHDVFHAQDYFHAQDSAFLVMNEKRQIISQAGAYLRQVWSLRWPHPGMVEAVDGTGCYDSRIEKDSFEPFTVDEYHTHFGHDYVRAHPEEYPQYQPVFARILVKHGKIVSIIDWERAGWYPGYTDNMDYTLWWELLQNVIDAYPDELELELDLYAVFVRC
ncbi:hypothetical protein BOTBODRAFT_67836 [Botryobasidium botryosum FD-172 SS1]|uniref:Aminoglycoside phosphotransferase domain-containing protein n=1 Tax=Botryobasidium botryosum (strain FD-172 SS1) TaxID=930990 RepID=A0A067MAC3_BOTB1|nr:hypothetical protein BOTBODRAFT_67836 [Botryobasidium botryosum FD-172 SS1]